MVIANLPKSDVELDKDFGVSERLFHYTSSQGLYGILDSGCLWATHFKFLNDSNEFFAARKSLITFVHKQVKAKIAAMKISGSISLKEGTSLEDLSHHEAKVIVDSMYTATLKFSVPYVFSSFVTDATLPDYQNGELLHWATYGRDGGYAIEINPHKLMRIFGEKANILSQKAVYVKDDAPSELMGEYSIIGKVAQEMIVGILNDQLGNAGVGKAASAFMGVAARIKDGYFKDERESRLVAMRLRSPYEGYVPSEVFIRHQNGRAVPYIKLFEGDLLGQNTPIEAIVIGPHSDREKRKEALSIYLDARGLAHIPVVQSEVPYLGG